MNDNRPENRVLVVDDEPHILHSLQDLLEDDFEVLTCTTAEDALGLLETEEVAVILSDQRMPGLTGYEFLHRARQVSQATRLLITGYADMQALVRAVNEGQIYGYIAGGIVGLMLESHLFAGNQSLNGGELRYGVSVTDACIDWAETETLLHEAADALARAPQPVAGG